MDKLRDITTNNKEDNFLTELEDTDFLEFSTGQRIIYLMKMKDFKLTVPALADKLGTSCENIIEWNAGKENPDNEILKKIADLMGVETSYLEKGYKIFELKRYSVIKSRGATRLNKTPKFYEVLLQLCEEREVKLTPILDSLGIGKGATTNWKKGSTPNGETLLKLADYFGVTTDYLLGRTNLPTSTIKGNVTGIGIVHDVSGGTIIGNNSERKMTVEEADLLRIYNLLDMKKRLRLLNLAVELEDAKSLES